MTELEQEYAKMVTALKKGGGEIRASLTAEDCDLLHMAVGISGEAGELLDAVKKAVVYRKPLDIDNVVEELGDLEFYMEGLRQRLAITREETLEANRKKLLTSEKARFKLGKYTDEQAAERSDKTVPAPREFFGSNVLANGQNEVDKFVDDVLQLSDHSVKVTYVGETGTEEMPLCPTEIRKR